MTEKTTQGASPVSVVLALVLGAAMVVLFTVLSRQHAEGRRAIDDYFAFIRSGADVTTSVGGDEAAVITATLRQSTAYSVSNFQGQRGTNCFWITLRAPGGVDTDARLVLVESQGHDIVSAISLTRSCDCPDDASEPCHLE